MTRLDKDEEREERIHMELLWTPTVPKSKR
jgi:hypothetical protein